MNKSIKVREHMTSDVLTVRPTTGIMQLVHLLVEREASGAVVTTEEGALAGIITERDCIAVATQAGYFDEPGGTVADFMSTDLETVDIEETVLDAAQRMIVSPHRLFPVVDDGRFAGVLSRRHVLKALESGVWFATESQLR